MNPDTDPELNAIGATRAADIRESILTVVDKHHGAFLGEFFKELSGRHNDNDVLLVLRSMVADGTLRMKEDDAEHDWEYLRNKPAAPVRPKLAVVGPRNPRSSFQTIAALFALSGVHTTIRGSKLDDLYADADVDLNHKKELSFADKCALEAAELKRQFKAKRKADQLRRLKN